MSNPPLRITRVRGDRLWLTALVGLATGCGGPAYEYDSVVTGTVTIEGELAPRGTITFHPVAKNGKIAIGRIYPDGSFSLRTGQGDLRESDGGTVVPGEYIVTVVVTGPPPAPTTPEGGPPGPGPLLVAKRYLSRDTSDLRRTVHPGANVMVFELERAAPEDTSEAPTPEAQDGVQDGAEPTAEASTPAANAADSEVPAAPAPAEEGAAP